MLKYLNSYYISLTFIPFIIFHLLFSPINSISGTDSEIFQIDSTITVSSDDETICPCDITEGVCDVGCCCDKDCLDLMLSNKYFDEFQCVDSSYTEKNIDSKLDYCDDYIESVDDLYNPLVLAFKILKRGFCIVKKQDRKEDEGDTEDYDKLSEEYESKTNGENNDEDNQQFEEIYEGNNKFDFNVTNTSNFDLLDISLPVTLPNGLCLFHSYRLKKNIDYEVTCSYPRNLSENSILNEFFNQRLSKTDYYIHDYYYNNQKSSSSLSSNSQYTKFLKKVEIIYYNELNSTQPQFKINHYYENITDEIKYIDLTVEVKFVLNKTDFKLSGNPGYIKGKKIIFGKNNTELLINGVVFPIQKEKIDTSNNTNNLTSSSNETIFDYIYFDNYFDNKITFEDLIIYGYESSNSNNFQTLKNLLSEKLCFTQFGNGKQLKDFNNNNDNKINDQNIVMIGEYKDSNTVNNTQFKLHNFQFPDNSYDQNNKITNINSYNYFIVKFVKLETETKWWYAPGPVIIKLPKNIMYPFKIGTSKYKR